MAVNHQAAMKKKTVSRKRNCLGMKVCGCCGFRLSKLSPLSFLKRMAKALCLWRRASRSLPQVSSSGRPTPSLVLTDTDTSSAIQDCIEFIHSAASLPTSDSLSTKSC